MKRCLSCGTISPSTETSCSACGGIPPRIEGFQSFAPSLAYEGEGFKQEYFSNLANLEAENFWFRARNRLIIWCVAKYCRNFQSFLEVGCGTGYVLSSLRNAYPSRDFYGSEVFIAGLAFASARNPGVHCMQMDAREVPFCEEFDVIGAFDVLEHIEEDELVLRQMREALRSAGLLLLTVPQHAWLWTRIDEYSCHKRRYSAQDLERKLRLAGFKILRSTSFTSSLLPVMIASRLFQTLSPEGKLDPDAELRIPRWIDAVFEKIMALETLLIRSGLNFPVGGSRLIVAEKI